MSIYEKIHKQKGGKMTFLPAVGGEKLSYIPFYELFISEFVQYFIFAHS